MENMAERALSEIGQKYDEMISFGESFNAKRIHRTPRSGMSGYAGDDLIFPDGSKLTINYYSEYGWPPHIDEVKWWVNKY